MLPASARCRASPNRPPFGIGTNYPDYVINPGHTVTAMLAAHRYRLKTGKASASSSATRIGRKRPRDGCGGAARERHEPTRTGNRHPAYSPHGASRCADDPGSVELAGPLGGGGLPRRR
ncbi:MAG: CoA transferase [Dehalococcoidia bacterium]|nr:CoA transferase [Dehalococcoidia bacterium]